MSQNSAPDFDAMAAAYITLSIQFPRIRNLCFVRQTQPDDLPDFDVIAATCLALSNGYSNAANGILAPPLVLLFNNIAAKYRLFSYQFSLGKNLVFIQQDQLTVGDQLFQPKDLPDFDAIHRAYVTLSVQVTRYGNYGYFRPAPAANMNQQNHLVAVNRRPQQGELPDLSAVAAAYHTLARQFQLMENGEEGSSSAGIAGAGYVCQRSWRVHGGKHVSGFAVMLVETNVSTTTHVCRFRNYCRSRDACQLEATGQV